VHRSTRMHSGTVLPEDSTNAYCEVDRGGPFKEFLQVSPACGFAHNSLSLGFHHVHVEDFMRKHVVCV